MPDPDLTHGGESQAPPNVGPVQQAPTLTPLAAEGVPLGGSPGWDGSEPPLAGSEDGAGQSLGQQMMIGARFVGALLLVAAMAGLFGWSLKTSLAKDPSAVALAAEVADDPSPAAASPRTSVAPQSDVVDLPDVRGSSRDEALAILVEAGMDPDKVTLKEVPWAPPAKEVVEQTPAPGTDDPEMVELAISKKAQTPNLVGTEEDPAVEALEALGVTAEIAREFRAGTAAGVVLGQEPAANADLTETATLTISEDGVPVSLAELDTTDSGYGCGSGSLSVNSVDVEATLVCTVYPGDEPETSEYVLAAQAGEFRATLQVASDSQIGEQARVVVKTEGGEIANQTVGVGASVPISGRVDGAQRLTITVSPVSGDSASSSDGVTVGLIDAEVLTSPDVAEQLTGD
ncbi:MAG: PASTA domain-containing protein [Microthrixaceae bacterium]